MKVNSLSLLFGIFLQFTALSSFGQQWKGLHYSPADLDVWIGRTLIDPAGRQKFKSKGDVSPNSPGDWDRIKRNADLFVLSPASDAYTTYYKDTGVWAPTSGTQTEPGPAGIKIRDAAFASLLYRYAGTKLNNPQLTEQGNQYAQRVREGLLRTIRSKFVPVSGGDSIRTFDWNDRTRFPLNTWQDRNPGFPIAEWLVRNLYTYDYTKDAGYYTPSEKKEIEQWFLDGARLLQSNADLGLTQLFVDRAASTLRLSDTYKGEEMQRTGGNVVAYGKRYIRKMGRIYNNRRATIAFAVGITGVFLHNPDLENSGKNFFKEWLMFGVGSDGLVSDFVRGTDHDGDAGPDLGFAYSHVPAIWMGALADAMARKGDFSLYNYSTTAGTSQRDCGPDATACQPSDSAKSLLRVMEVLCDLRTGIKVLYGTADSTRANTFAWRIDGQNVNSQTGKLWFHTADLGFSVANTYYKNKHVRNTYLRRYPLQNAGTIQQKGSAAFPEKPSNDGPYPAYSCIGGFPGVALMFGDREDEGTSYAKVQPR